MGHCFTCQQCILYGCNNPSHPSSRPVSRFTLPFKTFIIYSFLFACSPALFLLMPHISSVAFSLFSFYLPPTEFCLPPLFSVSLQPMGLLPGHCAVATHFDQSPLEDQCYLHLCHLLIYFLDSQNKAKPHESCTSDYQRWEAGMKILY